MIALRVGLLPGVCSLHVLRPEKLEDALEHLAAHRPAPIPFAGGTDLMVSWHHRVKEDCVYLDLSQLTDLRLCTLTDEYLELGALTTYWDVITEPHIAHEFPLLVQAARQVGAIQIQSRGTWAGNIANASPAADGVPVMMAYDATVLLQSNRGMQEVRLDHYYTGYKETVKKPEQLIRAIRMPLRRRSFQWFHKVGSRSAQAIAKVGVAMVKDDTGWRVVANSVAPTVCRCKHLEAALDEGTIFSSPDHVREFLDEDISPIDDLRSTADYRSTVLSRLVYFRLAQHYGDQ